MPYMSQHVHRNGSPDLMLTMDADMSRPSMKRLTDGAVSYIPAMMDGSCGTMPMHHRQTPMRIMMRELKIMMQNVVICVPEMLRSMWFHEMSGRRMIMSMSGLDIMDAYLQIMLGMMEMCFVTLFIPAFIMLPGFILASACAVFAATIALMCWPMNGDRVIRCPSSTLHSEETADEKWIYINGSMTR
jgi:hypothetical protein